MLKIRRDQLEVLSEHMQEQFVEHMVDHVKQFFEDQCDALGDPLVREIVRYGIQRAESYEIVTKSAVCKYVDLMFAFGRDFDIDPNLPWARTILERQEKASEKAVRLYNTAMGLLEQARGIDVGTH